MGIDGLHGLGSPHGGYIIDIETGKHILLGIDGTEVEETTETTDETQETEDEQSEKPWLNNPGDTVTLGSNNDDTDIIKALADGESVIKDIESKIKPFLPNNDSEEGQSLLNKNKEIEQEAEELEKLMENNPDNAEEIAKIGANLSDKIKSAEETNKDFNNKTEEQSEKESAEIIKDLEESHNDESGNDLNFFMANALETTDLSEEEADEDIEADVE